MSNASAANSNSKSQPITKKDFILSFPLTLPVASVLAEAKKKNISLKPAVVYAVRSTHRAKKKPLARDAKKTAPKNGHGDIDDTALLKAMADRGLTRTRELLAMLEATFSNGGSK